jgi:hypothetical protein
LSLLRGLLSRSFGGLIAATWFLCRAALVAWATLAIYYSNLPSAALRLGLAGAFAAFAVWALWLSRRRHMSVIMIALFLGVVGWWITIRPSHDRPWRPEVAVMPRAFVSGDRVRLTGVRNFDYRTRNDFTVRYEERELQLSHLTALDFYVSYFMAGPVGHTFLSFIFDNAPPLSISIETRPEIMWWGTNVTSWAYAPTTGTRRCIFIVSTPRLTMPAGCCWFTWRGSMNWPIGRSSITC